MATNSAEQSKTVAVSTATNATFKDQKSVVAEQDDLSLTSNGNTTGNQATIYKIDPHNFQCERNVVNMSDLKAIEFSEEHSSFAKLSNQPILMGKVKQNSPSRLDEDNHYFNENSSPNKQNGNTIFGNLSNLFEGDQKYEVQITTDELYDFENILSNPSTSAVEGNKPITIEIVTGESSNSADDIMSALHSNMALYDQCEESDDYEFGEKSHLIRRVREDEDIYGCVICGVEFGSLRTMYHHLKTHPREGNTVICTFAGCGKILSSKSALKTHVLIHENIKPHQCPFCPKSFRVQSALSEHMTCHGDLNLKFTCPECPKTFPSEKILKRHMRVHDPNTTCKICNKNFSSKASYKIHMQLHDKNYKYHQCKECGKKLRRKIDLDIHMRIHTGEKPYTCRICSVKFRHEQGLKQHMKTHENKENPLQCIHCHKVFDSFEKLNKHKRAVHPKTKTATCKICHKKLCSEASLATHMLIHDDVKNYKCSFCFKSFRHAQALKKHEQLHKNPEKPNQCVICQIDHRTFEELTRHNKKFHPKEKKYKCQECGKYLSSVLSWKSHQRIHTNKKPYKCDYCTQSFKHQQGQLQHMKSHHYDLYHSNAPPLDNETLPQRGPIIPPYTEFVQEEMEDEGETPSILYNEDSHCFRFPIYQKTPSPNKRKRKHKVAFDGEMEHDEEAHMVTMVSTRSHDNHGRSLHVIEDPMVEDEEEKPVMVADHHDNHHHEDDDEMPSTVGSTIELS